jgi:uncharacterized protein
LASSAIPDLRETDSECRFHLGAILHVSHIAFMPGAKTAKPATNKCPICGKPADAMLRPFCSKRCADVDLHRWLAGVYVVPVTPDEEEDERREETDERNEPPH